MIASASSRDLLAGVRVLDFTSVILGPYCTRILAGYGADVIKIEPPEGDVTRQLGQGRHDGMSGMFLNLNHGKRSVVLDLKNPTSRRALVALIKSADVVVHNMRSEAASRLGIDPESVHSVNPAVVYCAAVGFGSGGMYEEERAYDDVIQGASGLAALQTTVSGTPTYVAAAVADKTVALVAANAVLAALYSREVRDGLGAVIEVPMLEAMVEYMLLEHFGGLTFDPAIGPSLYTRTSSPHRRPFATTDGYVCAVVYNNRDWRALLTAAGRPELVDDSRLHSMAARTDNVEFAYRLLDEVFAERSTGQWIESLRAMGIAAKPMLSVDDLLSDPHLNDVGMFRTAEHPTEGLIRLLRSAVAINGVHTVPERLAPTLGQHTEELLSEVLSTEKSGGDGG